MAVGRNKVSITGPALGMHQSTELLVFLECDNWLLQLDNFGGRVNYWQVMTTSELCELPLGFRDMHHG